MVKRWAAELKCGRETLEALWEDQSPLLLRRSLPKFLQHHCRKESTKLYIVSRNQPTGSQRALDLIRNGFSKLVREERRLSILLQFVTTDETLVHHFQPEMKSELWKGSLPHKNAKTVMSAGKDVVVYIYRMQKEYCC